MVATATGCPVSSTPASGLLDYDVVLNVEFVVNIHNVYFYSLLVGRGWASHATVVSMAVVGLVVLVLVSRNYPLDVEELLVRWTTTSDEVRSVGAATMVTISRSLR